MSYSLFIAPHAERDLKRIRKRNPTRAKIIIDQIIALAQDPRPEGFRTVVGQRDLYRIVSGDFRVIYAIQEDHGAVIVVGVRRRNESTYKQLPVKNLSNLIAAQKRLRPK